jgi:hypothetical protein
LAAATRIGSCARWPQVAHPAVDDEFAADSEVAGVGGEEHNGFRDLLGGTTAAQRDLRNQSLEISPTSPALSCSGVTTRPGLIAFTRIPRLISSPDSVRASDEPSLGGGRDARRWHSDPRVDRGVEHDRAGVGEDRQQRLDEEERPLQVDRDRAIK